MKLRKFAVSMDDFSRIEAISELLVKKGVVYVVKCVKVKGKEKFQFNTLTPMSDSGRKEFLAEVEKMVK